MVQWVCETKEGYEMGDMVKNITYWIPSSNVCKYNQHDIRYRHKCNCTFYVFGLLRLYRNSSMKWLKVNDVDLIKQ